jgi:hypothetical protein
MFGGDCTGGESMPPSTAPISIAYRWRSRDSERGSRPASGDQGAE